MSIGFRQEEQCKLRGIAREALQRAAEGAEPGEPPEVQGRLAVPGACFVSLHLDGRLRGCLGCLEPVEPLGLAVWRMARAAALHDVRFPPLKPSELPALQVEISVLGRPTPLVWDDAPDLLAKLRPGVDGVVLRKGGRQATYLPQVWDQLPDPRTFLDQLSLKAGLAGLWCNPGAEILTFEVEVLEA